MALIDERGLAQTYNHPSVAATYDIVAQYRAVQRFDPAEGSTAIARELEIPRSRVRPWLDASKPDAVRCIEKADSLGWLATDWTPVTRALGRLCAGVYACGSIGRETHRPSWTPSSAVVRSQLSTDLDTVRVGRRVESTNRSEELWPDRHQSLLGRALEAAGAPAGHKNVDSVSSLPAWIREAPTRVQSDWVELVVRERGIEQPQKATQQIITERAPTYHRQMAELVEKVTGEPVSWSERGVTISAAAIRALGLD